MLHTFNQQTTRMEQLLHQILQKIDGIEIFISDIESRIEYLEQENVGTTNELYELQNRLDILDDPKYISLKKFTLGDS